LEHSAKRSRFRLDNDLIIGGCSDIHHLFIIKDRFYQRNMVPCSFFPPSGISSGHAHLDGFCPKWWMSERPPYSTAVAGLGVSTLVGPGLLRANGKYLFSIEHMRSLTSIDHIILFNSYFRITRLWRGFSKDMYSL
jgi:hypothetical protein